MNRTKWLVFILVVPAAVGVMATVDRIVHRPPAKAEASPPQETTGALTAPVQQVVTVTNTVQRYITNQVAVAVASTTNGVDDLAQALYSQITSLETDLAASQQRLDEFEQAEKERAERRNRGRRGFDMEKLKQEDPERYAEVVKQRQEFGERIKHSAAERATFLLDIETANMSTEQLANHELLQQKLAESLALMDGFGEKGPSREVFHKMRENYSTIQALYSSERDYVLTEIGRSLGLEDDDATGFSDYMSQVFEMTSPRSSRHAGGRGH